MRFAFVRTSRDRARGGSTLVRIATASLAVVVSAAVALTVSTACVSHNCDGSSQDNVQGNRLDDDTWESNPIDAKWLDFSSQRTIGFHFPAEYRGRELASATIYVSADELPNDPVNPSNWAAASGNLGEYLVRRCTCHLGDGGTPAVYPDTCDDYLVVKNDTCGKYYARVVVAFARDAPNLCAPGPGVGPISKFPTVSSDGASDATPADATPSD
jgi:hypothetical protein